MEGEGQIAILVRIGKAINRGDGADDDRVPSFQKGIDGAGTHHFDFVVHDDLLVDVGVRFRDVSFRLVEVEV